MNVIVKAPVIQILAIVFAVTHLCIELLPPVQKTSIYRSLPLKVVTLLLQTFLACLFYQVRVHPNSLRHSFIFLFTDATARTHTHTGYKRSDLLVHCRSRVRRRGFQGRTNGSCKGE